MEIIDIRIAPVPFNPEKFFGENYRIAMEYRDDRCGDDGEVNFASETEVTFITAYNGYEGERINCEEAFSRLTRRDDYALYGANLAYAPWLNYVAQKSNSLLEMLYRDKGIEKMHFFGDVIMVPPKQEKCILMLSMSYFNIFSNTLAALRIRNMAI